MNPEEIRLGNYILDRSGKVIRIDFIENLRSEFDCKFGQLMFVEGQEVHPLTEYISQAKPIKITDEWLQKFGFFKSENPNGTSSWIWVFEGQVWMYETWKDHDFFIRSMLNLNNQKNIIYVHQLQNLYYSLTGKELTIKQSKNI